MRAAWGLAVAAWVAGVYESVSGAVFAADDPGVGIFVGAFGLVFLVAGWFVVRARSRWAILTISGLFLVELAMLPTYPRDRATDWAQQGLFVVLGLTGLACASILLRQKQGRISPTG
jgi:hypothetical protein